MKKFFLILLVLFIGCLRQIPEEQKIPKEFHKIIEKIPPAKISAYEKLTFDFTFDIPESENMEEINASSVFQFSPPVEGKAWWERKDTLIFSPFAGFEPGKTYKCKIKLSLLSQKFSDYPPLEISFFVLENEIFYFKNFFESDSSSPDPNRQVLNAYFMMTKKNIKVEEAKEGIKVFLNDKPLDFILKKIDETFELKAPFLTPSEGGEIKLEFSKEKLKFDKPLSFTIPLAPLKEFRAEEVKVSWEEGQAEAILKFTHSIKEDEDFETYIRIEPLMDLNFSPQGNILKITGNFKPDLQYKLTILPGLQNFKGEKLKEEQNFILQIRDVPPEIKISQNKIYLSSKSNRNIRFKSINISKIDLSVYYIPIQNIIFFLQSFEDSSEELNYYEIHKVGKKIFSQKIEIAAEKNKWIEQDINLSIPENLPETGIFYLSFYFGKEDTLWECEGRREYGYYDDYYTNPCSYGYYYQKGRKSIIAVISDIALLALKEKETWNLWAYNILTGEPESGVDIEAFEYQNLLLEKQSTNRQGYAKFSKENISFFISKKGKNLSFIKVSSSPPPLEPFDLSGFYPSSSKGFNIFTYTERGVYRPSEDINLVAILRDSFQKPVELPLKCIFQNPLNQKISEEINSSPVNGVYYFKLKTDYDAPTGLWYANLYLGDELLKSHPLRVEMIVPPKIKPEIKIDKDKIYPENLPLPIEISSSYLFGAPSSSLPYNLKFKLTSTEFCFPKYKDFIFHYQKAGFLREEKISEGNLNEEGKAQAQWQFKKEEGIPNFINVDFILEVTEKGGRPAYDKKSLILFPYSYYVGVKFDAHKFYRAGENVRIDYVVLDREGNPVPERDLEVNVYYNTYRWWWEVRDIRELISAYDTELKNSFKIKSKDKPSSFDFTLSENWGSYFLEIKDIEEKESIFINIPVSYWGEGKREEGGSFLQFEGVKENYITGEKLSVKLKTPEKGTLFYAIVKGNKILKWEEENLKSTDTYLNINITEDMVPSSYLFLSAIQNIEAKNDIPLRSYAIIPFNVKPENGKLEMEVLCPEKVKPQQKFPVKIKILNSREAVVTLAVVDSGLINLTKEKTPDPYSYFYQKIAWDLQYRDSFDFFYPLPDLPAEYTYKVGGEGAGQKLLISPVKSNPFPPVVFFKGPIHIKGEEEIEVQLPNYLGEVKVIVVGTWNNRYGNHSKFIKVIDDLIPLATFPRAVAPLDEFEIPLQLFINETKKDKIKVEISSSQHFEITGENRMEVPFEKGERMVYFYLKAKKVLGEGEIIIDFKNLKKGKILAKIPIHPVNSYISKDEFYMLSENEEREIKIPAFGFLETSKASLTISSYKNIPLKSLYENILNYPFGCIEQTSSKLFATLFLRDLVDLYGEIFPELSISRLNIILEDGFRKIQSFMLPEGNFSFWPSNRNPASSWTDVYVTHILVEANSRGFALKNLVEKAIDHQRAMARKKIDDPKVQAYRLYVLSLYGKPDFPSMNLMKENYLKQMDIPGKTMLAASYARAGDYETAREIIKNLQDSGKISKNYEYLYTNLGKYGNQLYFLSQIYREYAEKFFQDITATLSQENWWSTHDIGWFCAGFSTFLGKMKADSKNINITLKYPDGKEEKISRDTKIISINLNNYISKSIKIKNNERSPFFLNLTVTGIPLETPSKEEYRNLRLKTGFFDENGREIDIKKLKSGDVIYEKIELQIFGIEKYIAISQILPGGWEPINLRLLNLALPSWISKPSTPSYTDIRDDRVNIFLDAPGYTGNYFFYIPIKVVTKGKFILPPTTAQAMYNPEFYAILPQGYINIE